MKVILRWIFSDLFIIRDFFAWFPRWRDVVAFGMTGFMLTWFCWMTGNAAWNRSVIAITIGILVLVILAFIQDWRGRVK